MKIADMRAPRLRAPPGHGGAVPCFLKMLPVIDPLRGLPFRGAPNRRTGGAGGGGFMSQVKDFLQGNIVFRQRSSSEKCRQQRQEYADPHGYHEVIVNRREKFDDPGTDRCHHSTRKGEKREEAQYGHGYAGEGPLPGLPVVDTVPAKPFAGKCGNAVEDREGNEGRNDNGYRKQDDAGKGAHAKEERPFPREGIAAVTKLHERRQDRDGIPPEDEVDKDHTNQEGSCNNGDGSGMVKKEDQPGDAKTKTEMDKLTDNLPHDDIP